MQTLTREIEKPSRASKVPKRLIFRLSSLGDVILASAALEAVPGSDWVIAREFAEVIRGHRRVGKVWEFDRKAGLGEWRALCERLAAQGYDEVFDLHQSIRTRIARVVFRSLSAKTNWRTLKKPRAQLYGYFALKGLWPVSLRPPSVLESLTRFFGTVSTLRPDLSHLLEGVDLPAEVASLQPGTFYCFMPSAQWPGKRWPAQKFAELASELKAPIVVLGTSADTVSNELFQILTSRPETSLKTLSLVGKASLKQVAQVLSRSKGYIGNDTGLAHLAEAVGAPAHVLFGPTKPDQGFGPWQKKSSAIGSDLWCRPCGKDGQNCFRRGENRFLCLKELSPKTVLKSIETAEKGEGQA